MSLAENYLNQFQADLEKAGQKMSTYLANALYNLQIENGKVLINAENYAFIQSRMMSYTAALEASGYNDIANKFISRFDGIAKERFDLVKNRLGLGIEFADIAKQDLTALAKWQMKGMFNIAEGAFNQVKSAVTINVLAGGNIKDITEQIAKTIDKDLVRYASTYAETGLRLYSKEVSNISIKESGNNPEDFDYEYVGPMDNLTRPDCVDGLSQRIFTYDEMQAFDGDTEPRYNCRHEFYAIPKETEGKSGEDPESGAGESDTSAEVNDTIPNPSVTDAELDLAHTQQWKPYDSDPEYYDNIMKGFTANYNKTLSTAELGAMEEYSGTAYQYLNEGLRENSLNKYHQVIDKNLESIFGNPNVKRYEGFTFRGEHYLNPEDALKRVNDILSGEGFIKTPGYLSTAIDSRAADLYAGDGKLGIFYYIKGKSGVYMTNSPFKKETEVLFGKNSMFRIIKYVKPKGVVGQHLFYLEEI
jgi:hypothetical protein